MPRTGAPSSRPLPDDSDEDVAQPILGVQHSFPTPPDRDLMELGRSLRLKSQAPISRVVNPEPVSYKPGRVDTFWLVDITKVETYSRKFELRRVSTHAYWYVQEGLAIADADIEDAARAFEIDVYPTVTGLIGTEWTPGVDNDPRLTILHARLRGGVAGYYSSSDEYPVVVHPYSNEREMLYMNAEYLRVGSPSYLSVLAHELHHVVHWAADQGEETWVNEGMAELTTELAGHMAFSLQPVVSSPTPSLVNWPLDPLSSPNYTYSSLFFHYLADRTGTVGNLKQLVANPADGIEGIDAYLVSIDAGTNFRSLFSDWLIANLLDEPGGGRYSYLDRDIDVAPSGELRPGGRWESSILQYAAEYVELAEPQQDTILRFEGSIETPLLPIEVGPQGCWWSNRGDSISSSLVREVDLSGVDAASLHYRVWFEVEENWDYGYLETSTDGGSTWDVIEAGGTTNLDPVGNSYGPGYSGSSDGWLTERVDLSEYAGRKIHLRFHYVTDDGVNGSGLCFDSITIPEIGFVDAPASTGWQAEGFVRVSNRVSQDYVVQVVEVAQENRVTLMMLDENNRGEIHLPASADRERVVIVVAALAPQTLQMAHYTLRADLSPTS